MATRHPKQYLTVVPSGRCIANFKEKRIELTDVSLKLKFCKPIAIL